MKIGVWIDKKQAYIVKIDGNYIVTSTIEFELDFFNINQDSETRLKGDPQDIVHNSKYIEREKHKTQNYFKRIVNEITGVTKLIIFGSGEMPLKFYKNLEITFKNIFDKTIALEKENNMTGSQKEVYVRDFYSDKFQEKQF